MTDPLAAIRAALPISGTIPVDWVPFGDSITESMVCAHREDAYPQRVRDLLRAATMSGSVRGGKGYCPSYSVSAALADFWSRSGPVELGVLSTGLGMRMLKVPTGASVSLGFTGTGLDVLYTTGVNSMFSFSLDGGPEVVLDKRTIGVNSGNTAGLQLRNLCDGAHTITIKGVGGYSAFIEGAFVYRGDENAGIRVWEAGHSGGKASDLNATDRWRGSFLAVPAKTLVSLLYGRNEYQDGVSVATFQSELATLAATIAGLLPSACSMLLMSPHDRTPIAGRPDQALYRDAVASVASANGYAYLDLATAIGEPAAAIAAGLIESGSGCHPTAAGHDVIARAITNTVLT